MVDLDWVWLDEFNDGFDFIFGSPLPEETSARWPTIVKLFSAKLKHNEFFISFIIHKGVLENETTAVAKSSPSSFISWNERYHFLVSSSSTKYGTLPFCVRYSLFIVHCSFLCLSHALWCSFPLCGVNFRFFAIGLLCVLGLFRFCDVFVVFVLVLSLYCK